MKKKTYFTTITLTTPHVGSSCHYLYLISKTNQVLSKPVKGFNKLYFVVSAGCVSEVNFLTNQRQKRVLLFPSQAQIQTSLGAMAQMNGMRMIMVIQPTGILWVWIMHLAKIMLCKGEKFIYLYISSFHSCLNHRLECLLIIDTRIIKLGLSFMYGTCCRLFNIIMQSISNSRNKKYQTLIKPVTCFVTSTFVDL